MAEATDLMIQVYREDRSSGEPRYVPTLVRLVDVLGEAADMEALATIAAALAPAEAEPDA